MERRSRERASGPHAQPAELLPFPEADEEPLELLLNGVAPEGQRSARRVAGFLRLLSCDARGTSAARSGLVFQRACEELERQTRGRTIAALLDLLRHHLRAHVGAESFAWYGEPLRDPQSCWRALEAARAEFSELPSLPGPGEPALEVAARVVAGLSRLELEPCELALHEARLMHAAEGPSAAEERYEALLDGAAGDPDPVLERAFLAGSIECLLDRGAVRDARLRLSARAEALALDARLARLAAWTAVACGELEEARQLLRDLRPWNGVLPAPLVELRRAWPEALGLLSGRELARAPQALPRTGGERSGRKDLGASLFAVLRFGPARCVEALHVEAAPGLRARIGAWLADREGACAVPTQPEHELVLGARPVRRQRTGAQPLAGALGIDSARALALTPILDEGEVEGWLTVECEHHLLPSARRLEELAHAWRDALRHRRVCGACAGPLELARREQPARAGVSATQPEAFLEEAPDEPATALAREAFEALVVALGIKLQTRCWWGIDAAGPRARWVANGGEGLARAPRSFGGGRAVARALATGGTVVFEEPDARLSIDPEAGSGIALPLVVRGRPCGVLALESPRRRDFRALDTGRLEELAAEFALALRAAQFRGWHLERFGHDVHLDTSLVGFRGWCEDLIAAARSRTPVLLSGEKGTGKTVFARWIHFESGRADEELKVAQAGAWLAARAGSSVLFEEIGASPPATLDELSRALEGEARATAARILATTSRPLDELAASGHFRHDLAARLARLELCVPALRERREEVPGLVRFFIARFAAEERERPPEPSEEACALLWRQPWEGNLRQLEAFVFKLVLLRPGADIDIDSLNELARRFRLPLVPRLGSRHPRRADLVAALRSTLLGSERINKRRAAACLGWDPDTLAARLEEAELDEGALAREPHAW